MPSRLAVFYSVRLVYKQYPLLLGMSEVRGDTVPKGPSVSVGLCACQGLQITREHQSSRTSYHVEHRAYGSRVHLGLFTTRRLFQ